MSKVSEILSLFKEQLNNQIKAFVDGESFENEGYGFAYWYFRNIRSMTNIEAKDQICDGSGDLGIDAIEVQDEKVVFYQFKNPAAIERSIGAGDVDKMLSGLGLILSRKHKDIANSELLSRLEEIYSFTPTGYRVVIVSSSLAELPEDAVVKLNSFCETNSGAIKDLFQWEYVNLNDIHNRFYAAHLPTLDATIDFSLTRPPYMTKIGEHETYLFDLSGKDLASLYEQHGESLLQQNVRMFEGDKGTNHAIAQTASSNTESKNFFHYNNGISLICDSAIYHPFNNILSLERPQVVNGGQTMRILHKCFKKGTLKSDVHAAVRVITTSKNKDFAANVAVNLNNQTRVDNTFLRSNDPRIVQLSHSLSAHGYYLERRAGEVEAMLPEEIEELENRYGSPLLEHVIPLKDGMQAYVATYYGDPQLAKKDPAKIFTDDGGSFSKILQSDLTAEKFLNAYRLSKLVSNEVDSFKKLKRKRYSNEKERKVAYSTSIGSSIEPVFNDLDAAVPQMTIFGIALIYEKYVKMLGRDLKDVLEDLQDNPEAIWSAFIDLINAKNALNVEKGWPTILKSGSFYRDSVSYLKGVWKEPPVSG
ncbi:AIPR family protein [Microbulbifer thermotolerans]|uniref:AIPR family protein n=1 Tax=Microbulbifer thermotolerans TaxID=252514 RepID=UPI00224A6BF3|nr:AIPR family protein [Microbulbifer thermotolerans]MCX2784008.1 AIPR family protein [Microbulbifer thermotolerans]MCX2834837.1 AIPR family protein [Microbulbifer thermotolerans]